MAIFKKALLALIAAALVAVSSSAVNSAEPTAPEGVKHVVWIGLDGFGAHYVNWDELPTLSKMRDGGSWTLHMRSVLPSSSAINWETLMVGAPSEMHGYRDWGSKEPDIEPIYRGANGRFPDIYRVIKDQIPDAYMTCVHDWDGISFLFDQDACDDDVQAAGTAEVLEVALRQLEKKPTFMFVCFDGTDHVGHSVGWGSPEYQEEMKTMDANIGKILAKIDELGIADETVVYVNADHGGSGKGHGEARLDHMEVPYIVYGAGIKPGEITDVVANFDSAPTAAWLLGVKRPQAWRGRPVYSVAEEK